MRPLLWPARAIFFASRWGEDRGKRRHPLLRGQWLCNAQWGQVEDPSPVDSPLLALPPEFGPFQPAIQPDHKPFQLGIWVFPFV